MKTPFFLIGSVRSGTTFLRDVLRRHPNLACPEETHFFRWAEPFGTEALFHALCNNVVLKEHRKLDGVNEDEFKRMLNNSTCRADLCRRYMRLYIAKNKPGAERWFDKTPQNVYGASMIASEFPAAKFVHIVRNPVDVVSSLRVGKVVKVNSLVGACNYWNEAAEIIHALKRAYPKRVYELRYEDFTSHLIHQLEKLLAFVGEEFEPEHYAGIVAQPKQHAHQELFNDEEMNTIRKLCARWGEEYGYFQ